VIERILTHLGCRLSAPRELHRAQFLQPRPRPFLIADGAFTTRGDAIAALNVHVELIVLREQLQLGR
jgi:hypothetical protein